MPRDWYVKESELDDYQRQIINKRTDRSFIVRGCAGSGKTILALWKAKEVAEANRGSYYVIVFTKALRQFIDDGIRSIGLNSSRILYYWEWKNRKGSPEADFIIVDEAQDFRRAEIQELKSKANKAVLFYGDSAQQLYRFLNQGDVLTMEEIATLTDLQMEQLVFNHRLPKKIARFAQHISAVDDDLVGRCLQEGTSIPRINIYSSLPDQYNAIINIINSNGLTDVGILFPHNQEVSDAFDYFRNQRFTVEAKYTLGANANIMSLDFTNDNPKLMTYHSAKGLQFETVFLPNCTVDTEEFRNPLYVAVTRTYQDLFIMHSGNLSKFINKIPHNLSSTNQDNVKEEQEEF